jgi:hypothetical protein
MKKRGRNIALIVKIKIMEATMNKYKKINTAAFFAFILCFTTSSFAKILSKVPIIAQEHSNTCWAASCRMVLSAYGKPQNEQTLMNYATDSQDVANCLYGTQKCCDTVLGHYAKIGTSGRSDCLPFSGPNSVQSEIDGGRPFLVRKLPPGLSQHIMVITGYDKVNDTNQLYVKDPKSGGKEFWKPYDLFVEEDVTNRWTHTLRLTTQPPSPLYKPAQIEDTEWISNGNVPTSQPEINEQENATSPNNEDHTIFNGTTENNSSSADSVIDSVQ